MFGNLSIPVDVLKRRMQNHIDELRTTLLTLHWWEYRKRWSISGAVAAYQMELEALSGVVNVNEYNSARVFDGVRQLDERQSASHRVRLKRALEKHKWTIIEP